MEKLRLFKICDIDYSGDCKRYVSSAKSEWIADLKDIEDAVKYAEDNEELYIIGFDENNKVSRIAGMVYGGFEIGEEDELYEEFGGYIPPHTDVAEWDYRVIASVAFGVDLMRGKVK